MNLLSFFAFSSSRNTRVLLTSDFWWGFFFALPTPQEPYTITGLENREQAAATAAAAAAATTATATTSPSAAGAPTVPSPPVLYALSGVVVHGGTPTAGHYTSFAKQTRSDQWLYFNDEMVTELALTDAEMDARFFGGMAPAASAMDTDGWTA